MRSSLRSNTIQHNTFAVGGAPPTKTSVRQFSTIAATLLLISIDLAAAEKPAGPEIYEDSNLIMHVMTRTPEQLIAFYSARGFNQASVDAITERCFVFAMVENKAQGKLWLVLDDWQFINADNKSIDRINRADWNQVWRNTGLPQAKQSTFGWTQLPESRDLHQHEHVGGQLSLPWQNTPFKLVANFKTASDKSGPVRQVTFENLKCRKQ